MRRLWCYFFKHKLRRPAVSKGGSGVCTSCKRCGTLMVRDYYDGWQRASSREEAYYLRIYGPDIYGM